MQSFNWECPHCNRAQTVSSERYSSSTISIGIAGLAEGGLALNRESIGCATSACKKLTLVVTVGRDTGEAQGWKIDYKKDLLFHERLLPRGSSKPQPDFIPAPLREDYYEACAIRELSPKASATLIRRCLQGVIRDFSGISKPRLGDEINVLRASVQKGEADRAITPETVEAIDHVRGIGNIGAHMERDIDMIVSVDPGEAQALIELVEMLFDEWYGARERRRERLARIEAIAGFKKALKAEGPDQ